MSYTKDQQQSFMRKAFAFAYRVKGTTSPNPAVGAVIVRNGRIIGSGATQKYGSDHAEVMALKSVRDRKKLRGADMFVTLEPCAKMYPGKKTPPCCDAIIAAGLRQVYIGSIDRNPKVNGAGVKKLRANGVKAFAGVLVDETDYFYRDFFNAIITKRPYVIVKYAMSMDGKIATRTGDSKWISSLPARQFAHELRGYADAVLVGASTYRSDNPKLNVRYGAKKGHMPVRIVVCSDALLKLNGEMFNDGGPAVIMTTARAAKIIQKRTNTKVVAVKERHGALDIDDMKLKLYGLGVLSILVEGGGGTIARFFEADAVDEVFAIVAPVLIGGKDAVSPYEGKGASVVKDAIRFSSFDIERIGDNALLHARKK
ncbi:MAG: bifunctional diaminohydroxyphosphoribosylaminopyrimidine deaminase/5-amino-6-(5-phosphoribosylamino)uracil reductase RibD [Spirochaetes bacterium]|nr:bifunctional diaminohydroxyphosphoribosylaminopyrimidine deaminase/5-amino-6-(5-phosphoribosylamino)uracil reductase RibD [Spirochaetota bacterium]